MIKWFCYIFGGKYRCYLSVGRTAKKNGKKATGTDASIEESCAHIELLAEKSRKILKERGVIT